MHVRPRPAIYCTWMITEHHSLSSFPKIFTVIWWFNSCHCYSEDNLENLTSIGPKTWHAECLREHFILRKNFQNHIRLIPKKSPALRSDFKRVRSSRTKCGGCSVTMGCFNAEPSNSNSIPLPSLHFIKYCADAAAIFTCAVCTHTQYRGHFLEA